MLADVRTRDRGDRHARTVRVGADALALPVNDGAKSSFAVNAPNAISLGGYAATIAWLGGAPWYWAIAGIAADDVDGHVARKTNTATPYGSLLDWAIDVSLTGLVLVKLGCPWLLLVVTPFQVYLRETGWSPKFGSARALFTILALSKAGLK